MTAPWSRAEIATTGMAPGIGLLRHAFQAEKVGSARPKPAAFQALTPPRRTLEFGNPSKMFLAA
jgi:hypothetical protein